MTEHQLIDLSHAILERLANLPGVLVRVVGATGRAIDRETFLPVDAAKHLVELGAALVGIDSNNIDDVDGGERPVRTTLLGADIPIVEHMTGLDRPPADGFRLTVAPPTVRGMGTFPVRAFARLDPCPRRP